MSFNDHPSLWIQSLQYVIKYSILSFGLLLIIANDPKFAY